MESTTPTRISILRPPLAPPYPFGLFSQITWLDESGLAENREATPGDAVAPATSADSSGDGATAAGLDQPTPLRWHGGVDVEPLPLLPTMPVNRSDSEDGYAATTDLQVKTDDWDQAKETQLPPPKRVAGFDAFTLIWKERRSTMYGLELEEQRARAERVVEVASQTYVEDWLYQRLLADDHAKKVTLGAVAEDYPWPAAMLSALESNWDEAGVPTLIFPRYAWPFLAAEKVLIDGSGPGGVPARFTAAGNPVVLAHGFGSKILANPADEPDDPAELDGVLTCWATGPLFGFRQPVKSWIVNVDRSVNDQYVMCEQTFLVGYNSYRVLQGAAQTANIN